MFKDFFDTVKQKYNEYVREYQLREQRKRELEEIKKNSEFKPGEAEALEKEAVLRHQNNLREQREAERLDAQNFFSPEANLKVANETEARLKQMVEEQKQLKETPPTSSSPLEHKANQDKPATSTDGPKPAVKNIDSTKNSPTM